MKLKLNEVLTPDSYTKAMEILAKERFLEEAGQRHGPDWSKTIELEMFRKDGSRVWTEVTLNLLYNEKGQIKKIGDYPRYLRAQTGPGGTEGFGGKVSPII